jgi:hypothetical protein
MYCDCTIKKNIDIKSVHYQENNFEVGQRVWVIDGYGYGYGYSQKYPQVTHAEHYM